MALRPSKVAASQQGDDYNHIYDMETEASRVDEPSVRELNDALQLLVDLFPDVKPEVFREMLTRVAPASRLEIVAEQLLKHDAEYIQGRYRQSSILSGLEKMKGRQLKSAVSMKPRECVDRPALTREDTFRNEKYKQTVKQALYDEFRSLSHSAVRAVLAENNYHYTSTRTALLGIASKSWRVSFANFLLRRKTPSPDSHPFIKWTASKQSGQSLPRLQATGNAELDQELSNALILPAHQREREAQQIVDNALAHQLAENEAKEASEEYDCEVCYSTVPIHKVSVCDDGGHYICFRCISQTISEAVYGQGWARSISKTRGTMKCVAPILDDSGDCKGCIPLPLVRLALADKEVHGESTLQKFEQRLASTTLQDTGLLLAHCPFCSYAEVDDLARSKILNWRFKDRREIKLFGFLLFFLSVATGGFLLVLPILPFAFLLYEAIGTDYDPIQPALLRLAHKSRGLRFTCRSPQCRKRSCLRCHSLWRDPHSCYSTQLSTLQKSIEAAQTAAVKRVCPKCNISFVKSSGCNKLVCPCGYSMCYLCRAEIVRSGVQGGYDHFCQHFRMAGGRCTECEKCDLYREEDEKVILKAARERAEKEWREGEGKDVNISVSAAVVESLVSPAVNGPARLLELRVWQTWLDKVVERFVLVDVD
jgi:hypothetical protein